MQSIASTPPATIIMRFDVSSTDVLLLAIAIWAVNFVIRNIFREHSSIITDGDQPKSMISTPIAPLPAIEMGAVNSAEAKVPDWLEPFTKCFPLPKPAAHSSPPGSPPDSPRSVFAEDLSERSAPKKISLKRAAPIDWAVGCGVHDEAQMTPQLVRLKEMVTRRYTQRTGQALTGFQEAFLTSSTLAHAAAPWRVTLALDDAAEMDRVAKRVVDTLVGRQNKQSLLAAEKPMKLAGSLRVVGFDAEGCAIVCWEMNANRLSMSEYIKQLEYVFWLALDLSGAGSRFTLISQFPDGYFNPMHFLNPAPLLAFAALTMGPFYGHVKGSYLVGMPRAFERLLGLITKVYDKETAARVHCVKTEEEMLDTLSNEYGVDGPTRTRISSAFTNRIEHQRDPKKTPLEWAPLLDHPPFAAALADLELRQDTQIFTSETHRRLRATVESWQEQQRRVSGA